jgi:WD40 repeat protein
MQHDGNFVIYNSPDFKSEHSIWDTKTYGKGHKHYHLRVQEDGNMVVYDGHNQPIWSSDTYNKGTAPYILVMQDDGNLVLYDSHSSPVWASGTWTPLYS